MNTSRVVALSSAVAFATQVAFALLMLRWFSPQEVGEFSVISQIGFFWMTLALAQAPVGLLTNQHMPAHLAAQQAWRASLWRGLWLMPLAALAVWFSQLSMWPALVWALLLAFCQVGWMLAQSFTLRVGSAWQQAAVRVLPPLTAAAAALGTALLGASQNWNGPTLLLSAFLGYAAGTAWLAPVFRTHAVTHASTVNPASSNLLQTSCLHQSDTRSTTLRMAHTLTDALLATAIVLVWQRLYGAEEAGWMSALLRVLGFVPAVVHMAWAQVSLARGQQRANPWWLGLGACACVTGLGALCALALREGWLETRWQGVWSYIWPLVLWQGSACLAAAFSHRPFQTNTAGAYSLACMCLTLIQSFALLVPFLFMEPTKSTDQMNAFALVSSIGLLMLTIWMSRLKSSF